MMTLRTAAKKALGLVPTLETAARAVVVRRRVAVAREIMEACYLYPHNREAILADYAYSLKISAHRSVMQVLNLEEAVCHVVAKGVPGAFVECGTYTGGASAFALRSLMRNDAAGRARPYWGFDSFEGMPVPTVRDGAHALRWMYGKDNVGEEKVSGALRGSAVNLAQYDACLQYLRETGYPAPQMHLVKGWFQDTLPVHKAEIGSIAILRIDGDFYESTKVVLENLFPLVEPGGVVIIDDYGGFEGCRAATDEYLAAQGLKPYLQYVDHSIRMFMRAFPS